ncbi:hypothetical protein [Maribacter sp. 2210JD10-5]|uniref:hypothetical protein n=1 Tax=Maribacter sp. 2210JD10-5 TaxID=3386272 RepID=UPI0039BCEA9A
MDGVTRPKQVKSDTAVQLISNTDLAIKTIKRQKKIKKLNKNIFLKFSLLSKRYAIDEIRDLLQSLEDCHTKNRRLLYLLEASQSQNKVTHPAILRMIDQLEKELEQIRNVYKNINLGKETKALQKQ